MDDLILFEADAPGICVITLNRPAKRNALSISLLEKICETVQTIDKSGQRVIVLRGAGPVFSSGLDLKEAMEEDKAHLSAEWVMRTLKTVAQARAVTIAAVH